MPITALEAITDILAEMGKSGAFSARRTAGAQDLRLEVEGVGRLRFPISRAQARRLCEVARPARYGRGERTLLDPEVRDTWEVPLERVTIDHERWNRTLRPVLSGLRSDLGFAAGCTLDAELHSMLVYGPGQFFLPHRDSEKDDAMVATLVVTLPSLFEGGELVVAHGGQQARYGAEEDGEDALSFVAFYADCLHEARPVKDGYRIVLTYNLVLEMNRDVPGAGGAEETGGPDPETADALARCLREYFETPRPAPGGQKATEAPPEPPDRLVYLLDHQYSESSVAWDRLKGDDALRVTALLEAAAPAGCEAALALAEVHETWGCYEDDPSEVWYGPSGGRDGYGDMWDRDPLPVDDPDDYTLTDLHDSSLVLDRWLLAEEEEPAPIHTWVSGHEVVQTTPSDKLEPYASEYQGYMGNWGNTMDRWYRRAALVLWPEERTFAVRSEASPAWALETLAGWIAEGSLAEARERAASLLSSWGARAVGERQEVSFRRALTVAEGLEDGELANSLLEPFRTEELGPGEAPAFVALMRRYGEGWARALLSRWSESRGIPRSLRAEEEEEETSRATLAELCEALRATDKEVGLRAARLLVRDRWTWLRDTIAKGREHRSPERRERARADLGPSLLRWLEGAAAAEATDLREEAIAFLGSDENEGLLPCLMGVLRSAEESRVGAAGAPPTTPGVGSLARRSAHLLEARLSAPVRDDDDWSMRPPASCDCELCATLAEFLAAPDRRRFEWPIAKPKRKHIHRTIDAHDLPVLHETRRSGRPYTLVLTKTEALFTREAARRHAWRSDLEWLRQREDLLSGA